ncbi:hypothetical protein SpCBS45565_g02131 [Spizellomyces sp. 'palustris']|nr:hypothetical protein SpCBS45565_g02131 [Spizellomyces sp. 'palustris']
MTQSLLRPFPTAGLGSKHQQPLPHIYPSIMSDHQPAPAPDRVTSMAGSISTDPRASIPPAASNIPTTLPAAAAASEAPPELAPLWMNAVSIKELAGRMIQSGYAKLQELTRSLPNTPEMERKRQLLDYALSQRKEFQKLLVMTKWGRQHKDWQRMMNLHRFIDEQNDAYRRTADGLYFMVDKFKRMAETPVPDVPTAIDVLGTGRYQRLPKVLRGVLPRKPLTKAQTRETLVTLDELIKRRLELEIIPDSMRKNLVIEKGCVTFNVNLFKVSLTLVGKDFSLPWRIVQLETHVKSADSYGGVCPGFMDHQMQYILNSAQVLIEQVQKRKAKPPLSGVVEQSKATSVSASKPPTASRNAPRKPTSTSAPSVAAPKPTVPASSSSNFKDRGKKEKSKDKAKVTVGKDAVDVKGKGNGPRESKEKGKSTATMKVRTMKKDKGQLPATAPLGSEAGDDSKTQTTTTAPITSITPIPTATSSVQPAEATSEHPARASAPKPHNPYAILHLHDFLQKLTLRLQLQMLHMQAIFLSRERWQGALKIEYQQDKEMLRIHFWDHEIPGPDPKTVPAGFKVPHRYNVLEMGIKVEEPLKDPIFETWVRKQKRKFWKHVNTHLVSATVFGDKSRPRRYFDIRCYSVIPDLKGNVQKLDFVNPQTEQKIPLALDPSNLDLERLLNNIAELQSRFTLRRMRNIALGLPINSGLAEIGFITPPPTGGDNAASRDLGSIPGNSLPLSPGRSLDSASSAFKRKRGADDVEASPIMKKGKQDAEGVETAVNKRKRQLEIGHEPSERVGGAQDGQMLFQEQDMELKEWFPTGKAHECIQPELEVTYRPQRTLKIVVDIRTGRIMVLMDGKRGQTIGDIKLMGIEQRLNDHIEETLDILMYMRYSSYIDDIEAWARRLGLRAFRNTPLKAEEDSKIAKLLPLHRIYLRLPTFSEGWIVVAVAPLKQWLTTYGDRPAGSDAKARLNLGVKEDDAIFRIWFMMTKYERRRVKRFGRVKKEMLREIEFITPLSADDVFGREFSGYQGTKPSQMVVNADDGEGSLPRKKIKSLESSIPVKGEAADKDGSRSAELESLDEMLHSWDHLDYETLAKVEAICRLQYGYTRVTTELHMRQVPYEYILGSSLRRFAPEELEIPETRIAGRGMRICIPVDYFAEEEADWRNSILPFGELYISIESNVVRGATSGVTKVPSAKIPFGTPTTVKSAHVLSVCVIKTQLGVPPIEKPASEHFTFEPQSHAITFRFVDVDEIEDCVALLLARMRSIVMMTRLAQQTVRNKRRLEKIGVQFERFDLVTLSLTFGEVVQIKLWWEDGGEEKLPDGTIVAKDGTFRTAFVPQKSIKTTGAKGIPLEMYARIKDFFEEHLNTGRDLAQSLLMLWHMAPSLRLVWQVEQKRNVDAYALASGKPLVKVTVHSLTRVQLVYAEIYSVDFVLHRSGTFAVYDSARSSPKSKDAMQVYSEIPQFYAGAGLTTVLANSVYDASVPAGTRALAVPYGVFFDGPMLELAVTKVDAHLTNITSLMWFNNEAQKRLPATDVKFDIKTETESSVIIRTEARAFYISVNAASKWKVATLAGGEVSGENIRNDLWRIMSDSISAKLNALPPGTNMRPFLMTFVDMLLMWRDPMADLLKLIEFEKKQADENLRLTVEWCLAIPPDAPEYLGQVGTPAFHVQLDMHRMSVLYRFTDTQTNENVLFPLLYNVTTGVLCPWEATPDNDFTQLSEMNNLLYQRLRDDWNKENFLSLLVKMSLTPKIAESMGLPGKLFPIIKQCCKGNLRYLKKK